MPTLIRRPNGNSTAGAQCLMIGATTQWDCVNDTVADDAATCVTSGKPDTARTDHYTIPTPGLSNAIITSVRAKYRAKKAIGMSIGNPTLKALIRLQNTDYLGTQISVATAAWTEYTETWNTNPATGLAWTANAVNSMEFGFCGQSTPGSDIVQVTQAWVEIDYTQAPTPVSTTADVRLMVIGSIETQADVALSVTRCMSMLSDSCIRVGKCADTFLDTMLVIIKSGRSQGSSAKAPASQVLDFLGTGLRFPFTFQRRSGGAQVSTATSKDHAHIHESIRQILGTRKGERFMRPEFGTRLHELVFQPNDRLLYGLIRHEITEALEEWEPRVIVTDVIANSSDADDHLVLVNINYRLISSQVEGNLVWPFYRELE